MQILHNVRFAVRTFRKTPGFTAVAILTLAMGIGANTALFSVVDALMLRPLPFKDAERLVRITAEFPKRGVKDVGLSVPEFKDLRDRTDAFEELSGLFAMNVNLTQVDEPERIEGQLVSVTYFKVLGAQAQIGRVFDDKDYIPGITEVAVISDSLWRRRFGADPQVIGRKVRLDEDMFTIIGVMPPGFKHPGHGIQGDTELWAPTGYSATPFNSIDRISTNLQGGVLARLKPGVTPALAQQKLDALALSLKAEFPKDYPETRGWAARVTPLQEDLFGNVKQPMLVLLSAVGAVLLIACANVANLLLARASARQRELAIRAAIGAYRWQIAGQLLTESILLALTASAVGLLMTFWSVDLLKLAIPQNLPNVVDITVDRRVLLFTLAVAGVTGILFGLAPALQKSGNLYETLKDQARGSTSGPHNRLRSVLVVSEFSLAVLLLIGSSLLIRSFWKLQDVAPGFNPEHVLSARVWMPQPNDPKTGPYFDHSRRTAMFREAVQRITAIPGVTDAGWIQRLPMTGRGGSQFFLIEGQAPEVADSGANIMESNLADGGYFRAMEIPLLRGRLFGDQDNENAEATILVSDRFAKKYFPNDDPVGKRIRRGGSQSTAKWDTIVGVVGDTRSTALDSDSPPQIYRSAQFVSNLAMALVVRTDLEPSTLALPVQNAVRQIDTNLPLYNVIPMSRLLSTTLGARRFAMQLLGLFAGLALLLSAVGVYGVMAYTVEQRTPEIGIRVALGAGRSDVFRMVLGRGIALAIAGVAIGIAAAFVLTRYLSGLLYGVSPLDALTFAATPLILTGVAIIACVVPARRAMRVDPLIALRHE